jgi:1,4-alpha-glucan branching enzyme
MTVQPSDFAHAPMGGTLVPDGATFRVWAPRARAVHVSGDFNGWKQDTASRMVPIGGGHWAGFVPGLKDGDQYRDPPIGLALDPADDVHEFGDLVALIGLVSA